MGAASIVSNIVAIRSAWSSGRRRDGHSASSASRHRPAVSVVIGAADVYRSSWWPPIRRSRRSARAPRRTVRVENARGSSGSHADAHANHDARGIVAHGQHDERRRATAPRPLNGSNSTFPQAERRARRTTLTSGSSATRRTRRRRLDGPRQAEDDRGQRGAASSPRRRGRRSCARCIGEAGAPIGRARRSSSDRSTSRVGSSGRPAWDGVTDYIPRGHRSDRVHRSRRAILAGRHAGSGADTGRYLLRVPGAACPRAHRFGAHHARCRHRRV